MVKKSEPDFELVEDPAEHVKTLRLRTSPKPATAREMRTVEKLAGAKVATVQTDAPLAQQMVVYLALTRRGVDVSWDDAADIGLEITGDDADPFDAASSPISPLSAVSGE